MSHHDTPTRLAVQSSLTRRHVRERRFRRLGLSAIGFSLLLVAALFGDIFWHGIGAFWQTCIRVPVVLDAAVIDPRHSGDPAVLRAADYRRLLHEGLRRLFPEVHGHRDKRRLYRLASSGAEAQLAARVTADPSLIGQRREIWVLADDQVDMLVKRQISPEALRAQGHARLVEWVGALELQGRVQRRFNPAFFTSGDSRDPERAGIGAAMTGSFYMLLVTLSLSFPLGVAAAIYLEELAPRNRLTDLIEVNINNLAAVPSIVFGLLGLAVFINLFGLPRSAPLVGGLVLTLMTLPTIIIAARASLRSVPPSIREAALGIGASRMQTIFHHVLPQAMPGMLTGTIIGMAQALGETAPLLMIGMVAFIVDIPGGPMEPATALPVQIYLWADSPERAFVERTSAAILVLLAFLVLMNLVAVILRRRFERRW